MGKFIGEEVNDPEQQPRPRAADVHRVCHRARALPSQAQRPQPRLLSALGAGYAGLAAPEAAAGRGTDLVVNNVPSCIFGYVFSDNNGEEIVHVKSPGVSK